MVFGSKLGSNDHRLFAAHAGSTAGCRTEHVANSRLGGTPLSIADRLAFWKALHERLAKLANRIDAATQGKILGAVHVRIPMAGPDEQRELQLANAEANERF